MLNSTRKFAVEITDRKRWNWFSELNFWSIKLKALQFQNKQGYVIFILFFDIYKSTAYLNFDEVHFISTSCDFEKFKWKRDVQSLIQVISQYFTLKALFFQDMG